MLKLDDEKLFATHPRARPRASGLPDVKDAVLAYGFPTGGSNLSITKGIVSRIEFAPLQLPRARGCASRSTPPSIQGNSGGPAVVGDKMIGLAFSTLGGAQNIGYIIPNEEIELFLKDVADGTYDGKPALFDDLQTLENPALRAFLKLDRTSRGLSCTSPYARWAEHRSRSGTSSHGSATRRWTTRGWCRWDRTCEFASSIWSSTSRRTARCR